MAPDRGGQYIPETGTANWAPESGCSITPAARLVGVVHQVVHQELTLN